MTIVELMSKTPVENIISTLANSLERVIFVGESSKMKAFAPVFDRFMKSIGNTVTQVEYRKIFSHQLSQIVNVLDGIVQDYPDCSFDLTGGDDLSLTAVGMIYERYRKQGVALHQYNVNTGRVYDCDLDGDVVSDKIPALTVEQNIILHGGRIVSPLENDDDTWDLTDEFAQDIRAMWNLCRQNCGRWNFQIGVISNMLGYCHAEADDLRVEVDIPDFKRHLATSGTRSRIDVKGIFYSLAREGLLLDFYCDGISLQFTFKSAQVKRCLNKAGTILELYTYLMATELTGEDGNLYYTDAKTGVVIDWDGTAHDGESVQVDTANEIDVMLMHGLVPVFISCKNGRVEEEELYKLSSVADRFGREYARRVLIATDFGKRASSRDHLLERAKDMNIRVIEDVHQMTEEKLKKQLKSLV